MSEIDASNLADAMVVDSEVDDTDTVVDEDEDTKKPDESDKDDSEKKEADQEPDEDPVKSLRADMEKKMEDFKASAEKEKEDLQKEIKRLGYALRKAEKGGSKKEENVFTDSQLLQMMKDHQDEPEVLFQIMKQMAKQSGESAAKTAESKAAIKEKRAELTGIVDKTFPGALNEGSTLYGSIQDTMEKYGLTDHPYGDVMALGLITTQNLPNFYKNVQEQTKKELLGDNADKKRKDKIKTEKLAGKGSKMDSVDLSPGMGEAVKRLGLTSKRQIELYKKFTGKTTAQTAA
jgi:hypothetical protein